MPSPRSDMATAIPSGKFWSPIPRASATAPARVAPEATSSWTAAAPKETPTARPSGMLCSVIASTSSVARRHDVEMPSASPIRAPGCRWGSRASNSRRKTPPSKKPTVGGIQIVTPCASAMSMDGARRDQKLAAIITPAANPNIASNRRWLTCRLTNTMDAPSAVTNHVNPPARSD